MKLTDKLFSSFKEPAVFDEPRWGPIGQEVFERTYSRVKADGSKESWYETVKRTVDGNCSLVPAKYILKGEKEALFNLIFSMGIIPAGRHLWVSGVPGRQFLFNCHLAGWSEKLSDHFSFAFSELMKGGGVGQNYSNRIIRRYGAVENPLSVHVVCDPSHPDYQDLVNKGLLNHELSHHWDGAIRIADSREGWVEALRTIIDRAMGDFEGSFTEPLVFDVSLIRPRGSLIKGFGGIASGPWALAQMLKEVSIILNSRLGEKLSSLDLMDIDHAIASCVIAGNVRRSARMAIKSWRDHDIVDFIRCKLDPNKHWTTNISVEIDDKFIREARKEGTQARALFMMVVTGMLTNGEPGFWNHTLSQKGEVEEVEATNPCGEIGLCPWENCNLGHINLNYFVDDDDKAELGFRLMARFLIRATFGDIENKRQAAVIASNRRIGVGVFGYQSWVCKQGIKFSESHHAGNGIRERLRRFRDAVRDECRSYSFELRIPEPVKCTTVAPTGTIANLPGAEGGIQSIYSPFFIRNVRYADNDPRLPEMVNRGLKVEKDIYSANTMVVSFICKDKIVDEVTQRGYVPEDIIEGANEISLTDHLSVQRMFQTEYVDNSISYTVNLEPKKFDTELDFAKYVIETGNSILEALPHLKGTTIMVDGSRPQAPYQRLTKEQYVELSKENDVQVGVAEEQCRNGACPIR